MARLRADDGITVPSDIQFLYPSTIQLNKVDLNLQNRKASTQTSVIHVDSFFFITSHTALRRFKGVKTYRNLLRGPRLGHI